MEKEKNKSLNFVMKIFRRYYKNLSPFSVEKIEQREFGFMFFNKEGMVRHTAFKSVNELSLYLRKHVPAHVYYSTAFYERPDAPTMEEKVWKGAELVFDIDVDHIPTECKKKHDKWFCANCGNSGNGAPPPACPVCGSEALRTVSWVCDECLEVAKEETNKLLDFLLIDFGFSRSELLVCFSGHRGFHIHVLSEKVYSLDQDARREVVNYVRGLGLSFPSLVKAKLWENYGWINRLMFTAYEKLGVRTPESVYKKLARKKKLVDILVNECIERYGCQIDERVTVDIKRLIRLPLSLHGKTGMIVSIIDDLDLFDPLEKASPLSSNEYIKVKLKDAPEKILNYTLDKRNGVVKLPINVGLYLILRGAAEVIGDEY